MLKTEQQILRKARRIQKQMVKLNNPDNYRGRELTSSELTALNDIVGQWKVICWLTERHVF